MPTIAMTTTATTTQRLVEHLVANPEHLISGDDNLHKAALDTTKSLFESAERNAKFSKLDELYTEGFDNDQIWEMLQLQSTPILKLAENVIKRHVIEVDEDEELNEEAIVTDEEEEGSREDDAEEDVEGLSEDELLEEAIDDEGDEEGEFMEEDVDDAVDISKPPIDDAEDDDDQDASDDEIDYAQDPDDLYGDDDFDASTIMYKDFYAPPDKKSKKRKRRQRQEEQESDEGEDLVNDKEELIINRMNEDLLAEEDEKDNDDPRSAHEKQVARIREQILELEAENVGDKEWTMTGEASSKSRPLNSLLEESLEFDQATKVVPIITDETTSSLEDLIRSRIVDNLFDDVIRKREIDTRPFVPSKQVELNDEKSKKSLAQIYEDEYVGAPNEKDTALSKAHAEIDTLFNNLFTKLDALSNFHYTPKEPVPSLSIVSNLPTIAMEEALPIAVSSNTQLAPEEVYDKPSGDIKDKTEMSALERTKERKMKKRMRKRRAERIEKVINKVNPGKGNKYAKQNALASLVGQQNVSVITKDGTRVRNSKQPESSTLSSKALKM